ncbi:DUF4158 domain-containing protein [Streptomyces sp. NPDC091280]|uniref:DUF4158 domain-containing protein n=1 Tax=Streptomyces sp. NPDC091280 TaxID=3365984 RepID=UPI00382FFC6B
MGRDLGLDGVVDHFTLSGDETGWLRNKTGATRLGFAVQLKFLAWRGRFPRMRLELPPDAVEHVAKQVGVAASELGFYDFTSRAAKRHRSELRDLTGWHECSKTDLVKLVSHLVDVIWHDERREEQVRAELLRQMRVDLIEPPTAAQITTIIRSALHQADERAVAEVAARLARVQDCPRRLDALVFTDPTGEATEQGDGAAVDGDAQEEDEDDTESVLSDIKSHPGNVSLNSLLDEIKKLKQVRAVGVPAKAFTGIGVQVVGAWRARTSAASPSHLRRFDDPVRHVLLAALLFQRQREITDTLVELLNSTVHRINARAEKKVTEAFVAEFTKVRGKSGLLGKIATASLGAPDGSVRSVVFPAAGGEKTLKDLVAEMKATNAEFARNKREVFKSSYSNHYRSGLMKLLEVLDFCSSNDQHKPVMRLPGPAREAALQGDLGDRRRQVAQPRRRPARRLRDPPRGVLRQAQQAARRQGLHRPAEGRDARRARRPGHQTAEAPVGHDQRQEPQRRDQVHRARAAEGAEEPAQAQKGDPQEVGHLL